MSQRIVKFFVLVFLGAVTFLPAQAQYSGGNNGGSGISTIACSVGNIYAGGSGDGSAYNLQFCVSSPTVRYTGGSYDGFSAQNAACTATYVNVSAGGQGDGVAYKSISCTNQNIYAGGQGDGAAYQAANCAAPGIYAGGQGDGVAYNISACSSTNIYAGGSYDGSAVQTVACSAPASIYKGGSYDGSAIATLACTSTNIYAGGSYDGSAIQTIGCTTPPSVYKGGSYDGSAIATAACTSAAIYAGGSGDGSAYNLAFCVSPATVRYTGGSYDGFSSQNIACPVNANVSTGGSGNGTAYQVYTCTNPSIYAGGSGSGSSYQISACLATSVYVGGSYDGTAYAIANCTSPSNVYVGGSYDGFCQLTVACPTTAAIYKGGSYDGSAIANVSCTTPPDLYAGGSYDGSNFTTVKCCFPPSFLSQPSNQTVCAGSAVTFSVNATGQTSPILYQWQENRTGSWANITQGGVYGNPTSYSFTLTGVTSSMTGYQYRCVASVSCGSTTTSNAATLTVDQPIASPANASVCDNGSITINGNPSAGSGTYSTHAWSLLSAGITGATSSNLTNTNQQTVTFTATNLGTGSLTLQYSVIDNIGCSGTATITVTVISTPTVSISNNASACQGTSITMTALPSSGAGTPTNFLWQRSSNGGTTWTTVQNAASANYTTDNTLGVGNYVYRVTVTYSGSSCTSAPSSVVSANVTASPTSAAGPNQEQCNSSTFTLAGNNPSPASGTWSIISGPGTITNATLYNTTVTGVTAGSSTVLKWLVTNGTCSASSNVTLQNDAAATTSNAGTNQEQCNTGTFTLAGNNPSPQSGLWTIVSGPGNITTATAYNSTVTGVTAGSSTMLQWTITNGLCTSSSTVTLINDASATSSNGGGNQEQCNTSTFTLAGNNPSPQSGLWTIVSGPGTVTSATAYNSSVTGVTAGSNTVLQWTITNGVCTSSSNVTLQNDAAATTSNAGSNQEQCNTSTFILAGNNPSPQSGLWGIISGPGTITTSSAYNSAVTGVTAGSNTVLQWTITNGLCTSSSNVTLTNDVAPTTSNAGSNQSTCGTTFTLAGNTPATGTGTWTQTSGPGTTTFSPNANTPDAGITITTLGAYTYQWSIANGICSASTSSITITFNTLPTDITPTIQANPVCTGSSTNVQLATSQNTLSYQLQLVTTGNGSTSYTNIGSAVAGTGSAVNLPTGTITGTDTFDVATVGGCPYTMSVQPIINALGPDFAIGSLIIHNNFGSLGNTTLPAGWSAAANSNGDSWGLNSSSPASGTSYHYINAIGGNSNASTGAYARTPVSTSSATPVVELISPAINTTGYSNISVYWGAKKTTDYTGLVALYYSTDGGTTWSSPATSFTDVQNDVTGDPWNLVNNSVQIKLPSSTANISTLKLKWVANPSTTTSYYSMNDVSIYGLSKYTLCGANQFTLTYLNTSCSLTKYSISPNPSGSWSGFSNVTNASLPATITVNYPGTTPNGTYNLNISMATATGVSTGNISFPVTVDPAIAGSANLDNCSCDNGSSVFQNIVAVYATGGAGNFTFSPLTAGDVLQTTIDGSGVAYTGSHLGVKGVFWSKADATVHQYQATDGTCSVTVNKKTQNGIPTDIAFASGSQSPASLPGQGGGNGISGSFNNSGAGSPGISSTYVNGGALTCHQTAAFGNTWVTYIANNLDASGNPATNDSTNNKAIVEINDYGQNLDSVSVSVYREPALPSIPNIGAACALYPEYALERHFVIQSSKSTGANAFGSSVGVRLYFSDAELQDLIYWTNYDATVNAGTVNASCAAAQVVNNTSQLYVTKYTGANEDGDYSNNSPAPSGLYRIFGTGATAAGNGPSYFDGAAGNGVFGNSLGANRHFVEMNVREFSEFWLHGAGDIEPLPVEIISLEADAINNEYIQVRWATDLEINNKEFEVERSTDGQNWSQTGMVAGHGNTTTTTNYSFNDMNVIPNVRYYYRLKQVDFNLQFKYTGVVSAMLYGQSNFNISIAPNPASGRTTLTIVSTKGEEIGVDIYDVIGQKVISGKHQLAAGVNQFDFDLSHLASGTYSVTVVSANHVYSKKLVITK